ncbi:DNA-directed RNA polymerase subunit D [Candidatus Pacearchaeota archaeon]|nr:DNA-directed RNA polymerase subunit D [Candidatus Pacearchaeota archaeon]
MEVVENTKEKLVLRMEANVSLANAIRRSLSEIPVLAVDEVEIFKNDSALYDEVVAHRIGLIPLKTEKAMSEKTKIDMKLSKKGPCVVYAKDLEGNASIVHDKIPITILGDNHKLELIATATLGRGIEHAKYIPGLCYYRYVLEVKSSPQIDRIVEKSTGLIRALKKGTKWFCDLNDSEINKIEQIDKDAFKDSDEIILVIESYGNMSAKEILVQACKAIETNISYFEKAVK